MRQYYVMRGDFYNKSQLVYTDDTELPAPYERITRKEAEKLARAEAKRRKDDANFAYYADEYVYPYGMTEDDAIDFISRRGWHTDGRIAVKED